MRLPLMFTAAGQVFDADQQIVADFWVGDTDIYEANANAAQYVALMNGCYLTVKEVQRPSLSIVRSEEC